MSKTFYVTTPIYYINDKPHIGHAYTTIAADVLARYYRQQLGDANVRFLTGTDEHGQKIEARAKSENKDAKMYADEMAALYVETWKTLGISNNDFIRTTDSRHEERVVKIVNLLKEAEYHGEKVLYQDKYTGLYCVGHESFVKESDLVDGLCPDHKTKPNTVTETDWFFKTKLFIDDLIKVITDDKFQILPITRKNEVVSLLKEAAKGTVNLDFAISRPNIKWGIKLPFGDNETVYVWVDALSNYITALGWPDEKTYQKFWPANAQLIGKDILKFHAIYWPAMLLALDIPLPKTLFVHGFFTIDGQKMSKTLGNVIDPKDMVAKYGNDSLRYYLLRDIAFGQDGDFSETKLKERYTSDLANGLGNLVSRVTNMVEKYCDGKYELSTKSIIPVDVKNFHEALKEYRFDQVLAHLWLVIDVVNKEIDEQAPWKLAKNGEVEKVKQKLNHWVSIVLEINELLEPFMPGTTEKIAKAFEQPVKKAEPLFPRLT